MLGRHELLPSLSRRIKICTDILYGLNWLAFHSVIHFNLKLQSRTSPFSISDSLFLVLVFEDWTVKVGDLGKSALLESSKILDTFGGSMKYSAPEVLKYVAH